VVAVGAAGCGRLATALDGVPAGSHAAVPVVAAFSGVGSSRVPRRADLDELRLRPDGNSSTLAIRDQLSSDITGIPGGRPV
jgi:hypothetical protein